MNAWVKPTVETHQWSLKHSTINSFAEIFAATCQTLGHQVQILYKLFIFSATVSEMLTIPSTRRTSSCLSSAGTRSPSCWLTAVSSPYPRWGCSWYPTAVRKHHHQVMMTGSTQDLVCRKLSNCYSYWRGCLWLFQDWALNSQKADAPAPSFLGSFSW